MSSGYNYKTRLKIYDTIKAFGEPGVRASKISEITGYCQQTIYQYTRRLHQEGAIEIWEVKSEYGGVLNYYSAVSPPAPPCDPAEELQKIIDILSPFADFPDSWDKAYKSRVTYACSDSVKIAVEAIRRLQDKA